jgi:hypothetical protein
MWTLRCATFSKRSRECEWIAFGGQSNRVGSSFTEVTGSSSPSLFRGIRVRRNLLQYQAALKAALSCLLFVVLFRSIGLWFL